MYILLLSCLQVLYDKVCEYLELEERVEVRHPCHLAVPGVAIQHLLCTASFLLHTADGSRLMAPCSSMLTGSPWCVC